MIAQGIIYTAFGGLTIGLVSILLQVAVFVPTRIRHALKAPSLAILIALGLSAMFNAAPDGLIPAPLALMAGLLVALFHGLWVLAGAGIVVILATLLVIRPRLTDID